MPKCYPGANNQFKDMLQCMLTEMRIGQINSLRRWHQTNYFADISQTTAHSKDPGLTLITKVKTFCKKVLDFLQSMVKYKKSL
jgi:hypothetical protein